jgi:TPP-dependent pyruvate/acetoin dehydrogenase alpha subunit
VDAGLDRNALVGLYRSMLLTRRLEEMGHVLYKQGTIAGSFYTGRGNEAASVGVAAAMAPEDVGTPLHRNLGVHIVRGTEPGRILAGHLALFDYPNVRLDSRASAVIGWRP